MLPDLQALETPGDALPRPHDNCYWLLPGHLLAGEYPGVLEAHAQALRLAALLDAGVRCVLNLTETAEGLPPYADALLQAVAQRGIAIRIEQVPITDYAVPSVATMQAILATLNQAILAVGAVYLHCHGGIGRTGTVVGCLLVELGLSPAQALALIATKWRVMAKRHRAPESPETAAQREFILNWPVSRLTAWP